MSSSEKPRRNKNIKLPLPKIPVDFNSFPSNSTFCTAIDEDESSLTNSIPKKGESKGEEAQTCKTNEEGNLIEIDEQVPEARGNKSENEFNLEEEHERTSTALGDNREEMREFIAEFRSIETIERIDVVDFNGNESSQVVVEDKDLKEKFMVNVYENGTFKRSMSLRKPEETCGNGKGKKKLGRYSSCREKVRNCFFLII